jgi:hypothetical protein
MYSHIQSQFAVSRGTHTWHINWLYLAVFGRYSADRQSASQVHPVSQRRPLWFDGLGEVSLFRAFYRLGELASNQLWMVRRVFIFRDKRGSLEKRIIKHVTLPSPRASLP